MGHQLRSLAVATSRRSDVITAEDKSHYHYVVDRQRTSLEAYLAVTNPADTWILTSRSHRAN